MEVRSATAADLPRIVDMGARFLREVYADRLDPPDPECLRTTAAWLLDGSTDRTVFVAETATGLVGMIGLFVHPHPFTGQRTATEMFWWIDPEARGPGMRLLRAAETWARRAGAATLQMVAPDPAVERFYERVGFTRVETSYTRRL